MKPKRVRSASALSVPRPTLGNEIADGTTPFQLAQTAIALCQLRKGKNPSNHFKEAGDILAEAHDYLETDWETLRANMAVSMDWGTPEDYRKLNMSIPFEKLLGKRSEKQKGKKHRTWVGSITTQTGLEKAIRRYFPASDASRIIEGKALTPDEWIILQKAQERAIRARAEKRVKSQQV